MTNEEIIRGAVAVYETEFRRRFEFMAVRCESPIEELFLAALLAVADDCPSLRPASFFGCDWEFKKERLSPWNGVDVFLQANVGGYRADVFFDDLLNGDRRFVVVELDGHDFHERTKEQATRDKRRDRYFASLGIRVLRFTGSEVYRDPLAVAEEVFEHLGSGEHAGRG